MGFALRWGLIDEGKQNFPHCNINNFCPCKLARSSFFLILRPVNYDTE